MSEKKQKNVQTAEVQKQNKEAETAAPAQPQPTSESSSGNVPSILDIAKNIPDEKVKMAEDLGIPITALLQWMYRREQFEQAIVQSLPEIVQKNTLAAIEQAKQQQVPMPNQPSQPQGQSESLGSLIKEALSSGGGGADATTLWLAEIGKEQMAMSRILYQEFVKRMVPDIAQKMQDEMAKVKPAGAT